MLSLVCVLLLSLRLADAQALGPAAPGVYAVVQDDGGLAGSGWGRDASSSPWA